MENCGVAQEVMRCSVQVVLRYKEDSLEVRVVTAAASSAIYNLTVVRSSTFSFETIQATNSKQLFANANVSDCSSAEQTLVTIAPTVEENKEGGERMPLGETGLSQAEIFQDRLTSLPKCLITNDGLVSDCLRQG